MMRRASGRRAVFALIAAGTLAVAGCGQDDAPPTKGGPVVMRRLSEEQYRQSIADVFGPDIRVAGRFEPDVRKSGLLAVGAGAVTVTPSGFEQSDGRAIAIAAQVVDKDHRDKLIPCRPASAKAADDACAAQFLRHYGRLLFRHPMREARLQQRVGDANRATAVTGDFYSGLAFALAPMLYSPEFLFRMETSEPDPEHPGMARLDAFSKASRLSFLLWNTTPDDALLTAAEHGDLDTRGGLSRQVDRMLASPRLESGVRAFVSDFLGFDEFDTLAKDPVLYPAFNQRVAVDAREQVLRTAIDQLVTRDGDYRDLFTTRRTFLTRSLGPVYDVPVRSETGWEPHEFPADDPRAGLLTEVGFTALHSHPGRSSPTLRGKAIRELVLCEPVPAPPANVNFALVQDTTNPRFRTARDRLTAHRAEPTCAGCHKIMDPVGLALENFDALGAYRVAENGAPIDASGDLDGMKFTDPAGLGKAMHDNPATVSCLVGSLYRYATGRAIDRSEQPWQKWLEQRFAADGYLVPELLRRIATSDAFFAIAPERQPNPSKEAMK